MDIEAAIEDIPRLYRAHMTLADRRARGTEDKAPLEKNSIQPVLEWVSG